MGHSLWRYTSLRSVPSFGMVEQDSGSQRAASRRDRKSTRLNPSHGYISYAVFCLKKKTMYRSYPTHILTLLNEAILRHPPPQADFYTAGLRRFVVRGVRTVLLLSTPDPTPPLLLA